MLASTTHAAIETAEPSVRVENASAETPIDEILRPHQLAMAEQCLDSLYTHGFAYLAAEMRTGKSRAAVHVVNELRVRNAVVFTKKAAISGVQREAFFCRKPLTVTNYEQVTKLNSADYDFVIIDEAHCIGTPGPATKRFKQLRAFCAGKPVLLMSGTPLTESPLAAYYQFGVSSFTPFRHETFYEFFREHGVPTPMRTSEREFESYKVAKPTLLPLIDQYLIKVTQEQAGIEHKAKDNVHRLTLPASTRELIRQLRVDGVAHLADGRRLIGETDAAVRVMCHQLETGALTYEGEVVETGDTTVMQYIRDTFGDTPDVAVMCHFHATAAMVTKYLPNVHVYSSEAHSSGVDLSAYRAFVIVNTGYSGVSHVQRRDRATRLDSGRAAVVHHLVCRGVLSTLVYAALSQKLSFNLNHLRSWRRQGA